MFGYGREGLHCEKGCEEVERPHIVKVVKTIYSVLLEELLRIKYVSSSVKTRRYHKPLP